MSENASNITEFRDKAERALAFKGLIIKLKALVRLRDPKYSSKMLINQ